MNEYLRCGVEHIDENQTKSDKKYNPGSTISGGIKKETCKNSMVVQCNMTFDKLQFNGFIKSHKGIVPCLIEFVKYNYTE